MTVPFLDLSRQYSQIQNEVESAVLEVMRSGAFVEGPAVKSLEAELAEYIDVKHVITCGNGTDALEIALKAVGIGPGDEVITTPFSFFATSEAISSTGAIPVFVDIQGDSLNIDPALIEAAITEKTKAILPVHIFGTPADMDEINAIAKHHNLFVIEDACQAIGSTYKGKMAGNLGDLACFSFYPTKNLGAFGDGGMITTNSDTLANACRALKAHAAGKTGFEAASSLGYDVGEMANIDQHSDSLYDPYKYYNYLIGSNSRLDSIQAAILLVKLKKLDEYNSSRRQIAKRYNEAFHHLPLQVPVSNDNDYRSTCWHQYAVLCEDKDAFIKKLEEAGIGVGAFYPVPLHLQKAYIGLGYKEGSLPVVESVCKRSVCLPVFPEMTVEDQDQVISAVESFFA